MPAEIETGGFLFPGGPTGCLLIHGFSGTPYEMRELGVRLAGAGHTVRGVHLPGHATHGPELVAAGWRDWYAAAVHGLDDLARQCSSVTVVGLSMGALLALRLAAERADTVGRVAVLAPALVLADGRLRRAAPFLRLAGPWLPRRWAVRAKESSDIADGEARAVHPLFPMPVRGMADLVALQRQVRPLLPRVRQPVLILHGRLDRTCPLENVEILRAEIGSTEITSRIFERSAHVLTVDVERLEVADEVLRHVAGA